MTFIVSAGSVEFMRTYTEQVYGIPPERVVGSAMQTRYEVQGGKPSLLRRLLLIMMAQTVRSRPERMEPQFLESLSEPDRKLLQDQPQLLKMSLDSWREAFHSGTAGVQHDATLYTRPWGFNLQDIQTEIHLWHGENDNNVPASVGHYATETIPNCQAKFYPEEGHFSLPVNHMREILNTLINP